MSLLDKFEHNSVIYDLFELDSAERVSFGQIFLKNVLYCENFCIYKFHTWIG